MYHIKILFVLAVILGLTGGQGGCGGGHRCMQEGEEEKYPNAQEERTFSAGQLTPAFSGLYKKFLAKEIKQLSNRISSVLQRRDLVLRGIKARKADSKSQNAAAPTVAAPAAAPTVVAAVTSPLEKENPKAAATKSSGDNVDVNAAIESRFKWMEKIMNLKQNIWGNNMFDVGGQFAKLDQLFKKLQQQAEAIRQKAGAMRKTKTKPQQQQQDSAPIYKTFSQEKKLPNGQIWKEKGSLTVQKSNNNQTGFFLLSQSGQLVNYDNNTVKGN